MDFDVRDYRILMVDDEEDALELYEEFLQTEFVVETASSGQKALNLLAEKEFHLMITDLVMPVMDGLELISEVKNRWNDISTMVISGQATVSSAVAAMKAGAEELILKPVTDLEFLSLLIRRSLQKKWLMLENRRLNKLLTEKSEQDTLLGSSKIMQSLMVRLNKVAPLETTILLTGETGSGKSFLAKVIHDKSQRADRKFVSINCGALSESLLESTLFGHKRGAFTGAVRDKKGLFEEADGGTLFLDEISETSLAFQVKLLNAIESGKIRNVGAEKEIKVDVRLIFATNRDLREEVETGRFRKDLYFRINVVNLRIPSLRERKEDIGLMSAAFLIEFCEKHSFSRMHFSDSAREMMRIYPWEGNIRELKNSVEHAAVMCDSDEIRPEHLPEYLYKDHNVIITDFPQNLKYREAKDMFEKSYFEHLLHKNKGNVTVTARESGLARQCVYRKLELLEMEPGKYR